MTSENMIPPFSEMDNGKLLGIVDGQLAWVWGSIPPHPECYGVWKCYRSDEDVPTFSASDYTAGMFSDTGEMLLSGAADVENHLFVVSFWSDEPLTYLGAKNVLGQSNLVARSEKGVVSLLGGEVGYTYTLAGIPAGLVNTVYKFGVSLARK